MTAEEELQGGIRNALERGIPVEKVAQTFINAGYAASSVHTAVRAVTEGATTIAPQAPTPYSGQKEMSLPKSAPVPVPQPIQMPSVPMTKAPEPARKDGPSTTKVIILVVILILLLVTLAGSLLFKEQMLSLLG